MKKFLERVDLDEKSLSSLSLNTLLAEEIEEESDSSIVVAEYRTLSCSYYNNKDHVSYSYFKDIVIPNED